MFPSTRMCAYGLIHARKTPRHVWHWVCPSAWDTQALHTEMTIWSFYSIPEAQ